MLLERPAPIDWGALIAELQAHGMSYRQIGAAISVDHVAVFRWRHGVSPGFEDGRALIHLSQSVGCFAFETTATSV